METCPIKARDSNVRVVGTSHYVPVNVTLIFTTALDRGCNRESFLLSAAISITRKVQFKRLFEHPFAISGADGSQQVMFPQQ